LQRASVRKSKLSDASIDLLHRSTNWRTWINTPSLASFSSLLSYPNCAKSLGAQPPLNILSSSTSRGRCRNKQNRSRDCTASHRRQCTFADVWISTRYAANVDATSCAAYEQSLRWHARKSASRNPGTPLRGERDLQSSAQAHVRVHKRKGGATWRGQRASEVAGPKQTRHCQRSWTASCCA
jgi:hypothetical protein